MWHTRDGWPSEQSSIPGRVPCDMTSCDRALLPTAFSTGLSLCFIPGNGVWFLSGSLPVLPTWLHPQPLLTRGGSARCFTAGCIRPPLVGALTPYSDLSGHKSFKGLTEILWGSAREAKSIKLYSSHP